MGKRLIIRGADFSQNGFKGIQFINALTTSVDGDTLLLNVPAEVTTRYTIEIKFQATEILPTTKGFIYSMGEVFSGRSHGLVSYMDGRLSFLNDGLRGDFDDLFFGLDKTVVNVSHSETVINGVVGAMSLGSELSTVDCQSIVTLYGNNSDSAAIKAGVLKIAYFKVFHPDNGELVADFRAAKDIDGEVCMYDVVNGVCCYASKSKLIVAEID